jgi:hypothetical protein
MQVYKHTDLYSKPVEVGVLWMASKRGVHTARRGVNTDNRGVHTVNLLQLAYYGRPVRGVFTQGISL